MVHTARKAYSSVERTAYLVGVKKEGVLLREAEVHTPAELLSQYSIEKG